MEIFLQPVLPSEVETGVHGLPFLLGGKQHSLSRQQSPLLLTGILLNRGDAPESEFVGEVVDLAGAVAEKSTLDHVAFLVVGSGVGLVILDENAVALNLRLGQGQVERRELHAIDGILDLLKLSAPLEGFVSVGEGLAGLDVTRGVNFVHSDFAVIEPAITKIIFKK